MPSSNCESPTQSENSSLFVIGLGEEGRGRLRVSRMRKVLRRTEEASRICNTSSATVRTVRYGECQKNHAAGVGGYAVDGCREFMASNGEEESSGALTCAACGCHRNFHRREVETEVE